MISSIRTFVLILSVLAVEFSGGVSGSSVCSNGIAGVESSGGSVCCVAECGTCGGNGCRDFGEDAGLGAADCCVTEIADDGEACSVTGTAPCYIDRDIDGSSVCSNGITGVESPGGTVCCAVECGTCGGDECRNFGKHAGLGADDCCVTEIADDGEACSVTGTSPCYIYQNGSGDDDSSDDNSGTSPRGIPDTTAPTTPADTPAPITPADTPAPTIVTYTAAPVAAANTRAPVAAASTLAPIAAASNTTTPVPATYTPAPSTGAESEEFQGLGIPGDLQDIILADAAGGFAGSGSVTFSDSSSEDSILASEAGSFTVVGSFALADGGALDPDTVLYLYIFDGTSSDNSGASRGVAAVDADTGVFTAAVTDAPVGSSTLVLSFVLDEALTSTTGTTGTTTTSTTGAIITSTTTTGSGSSGGRGLRSSAGAGAGRDEARHLLAVGGTRSVFTAPVVNPNSCDNALAITLEWFDGSSDVDLWVTEPGGQNVGFYNKQGDAGFLDYDNIVGYGPENYVVNAAAVTSGMEVYGTYTFRVHGYSTWGKDISYQVVVRKEGQEVMAVEGSVSDYEWSEDSTVELDSIGQGSNCA